MARNGRLGLFEKYPDIKMHLPKWRPGVKRQTHMSVLKGTQYNRQQPISGNFGGRQ